MIEFSASVAYFMRRNADTYIEASKRAHRAMDPGPTPDLPWGCSCGRAFATQRGRNIHTSKAVAA